MVKYWALKLCGLGPLRELSANQINLMLMKRTGSVDNNNSLISNLQVKLEIS